jgi:tetratricopeptide (TPR) repeat protein
MKILNLKSEEQLSECRKHAFAIITISILIFSIYSNTFHASWHFDDEQNIEKNARLHLTDLSWQNVKNTLFASTDGTGKIYRPIACFSFAVNYYFGKLNVFGYHVTNICIHLVASLFLFLFIYGVLRLPVLEARYGPDAYSIALLSTVLWAVNPVQTQAITYIVQRMASMAAMFYIMAMYFYLRARSSYQRYPRFTWFLLCLLSGIFAFGSKENAAMLPISLFLFDLLLIQGVTQRNVKKNAIILAVLVLVPLILALLLKGPSLFDPSRILSGYGHRGFTLGQRLLTEPRVIVYYMSLLLYPMPNRLCVTHVISPSHGLLHPPTTLLSILLILFLLSIAAAKSKKWPFISFCVVFFFLNHVIESTIFPLELIFEHRNYLPSMLFFVPVGILLIRSIEFFSGKPGMRFAISGLIVVIIIGFGNSTFVRNFTWRTEESLWIDAIDKNPDSVRAHHNLGRYYSDISQPKKAISEYLAALALKPETYGEKAYLTHYNLGLEYAAISEDKKAIKQFRSAIGLFPRFADAYCDLAVIMTREGNYEEAYKDLIISLTYNRNSPQAHNNLGYVLIKKKDYAGAIIELQKALKLRKDSQVTLRNLGIAYKHEKDFQKAIYFFRSIIRKNPKDILARLHLADTYACMDKPEIAERFISKTVDLIGPRELYPMLRKFLRGDSLQEFSRKSIVVSLLQKAYADRGKSLERMGEELATTSVNDPRN